MENFRGLVPFALIIIVMYVFMIMPQNKRRKNEKNFVEGLKKGDKVVTKSGLHGRVFEVSEKLDAVVLETQSGKLTFDKSAISYELSQKLVPSDKVKKA